MAACEPASFWWETVIAVVILLRVLGPLHMHPRIFLNPQLFPSGFKSFHVHTVTYRYPNRLCPSTRIRIHSNTQDSAGKIGNKACVTKRAKFAPCSALRANLTTRLPSWIQYSRWRTGLDIVTSPNEKASGFSVRQNFPLWRADSKMSGYVWTGS